MSPEQTNATRIAITIYLFQRKGADYPLTKRHCEQGCALTGAYRKQRTPHCRRWESMLPFCAHLLCCLLPEMGGFHMPTLNVHGVSVQFACATVADAISHAPTFTVSTEDALDAGLRFGSGFTCYELRRAARIQTIGRGDALNEPEKTAELARGCQSIPAFACVIGAVCFCEYGSIDYGSMPFDYGGVPIEVAYPNLRNAQFFFAFPAIALTQMKLYDDEAANILLSKVYCRRAVQDYDAALVFAAQHEHHVPYEYTDAEWTIVQEFKKDTKLDSMKGDHEFMLEAVAQNGAVLYFADTALKGDRNIVKAAVKQNGAALTFAATALKGDPAIVKEAVKQQGMALLFASDTLKANRSIVLEAVKQNSEALHFAAAPLKFDPEIQLLREAAVGKAFVDQTDVQWAKVCFEDANRMIVFTASKCYQYCKMSFRCLSPQARSLYEFRKSASSTRGVETEANPTAANVDA